MIQDATLQDIPTMVARAKESHARSVHRHIPFVFEDTGATFAALIQDENGIVLTNEAGAFFAGALTPFHFNHTRWRLIEIGFDGLPIKPLKKEIRARVPHRTEIIFAQEPGKRARALGRLYRIAGLRPSALNWTMEM